MVATAKQNNYIFISS